nr:hypothetical protein [Caproicibacter fermentans]
MILAIIRMVAAGISFSGFFHLCGRHSDRADSRVRKYGDQHGLKEAGDSVGQECLQGRKRIGFYGNSVRCDKSNGGDYEKQKRRDFQHCHSGFHQTELIRIQPVD